MRLFDRISRALYGSRWIGAVADLLQVHRATVRRWRRRPELMPAHSWRALMQEVVERQRLLEDLEREFYAARRPTATAPPASAPHPAGP